MRITGTSNITGILTLELRDPMLRAYRSVSVRNGQVVSVPDVFRFAPEVTDALARNYITVSLADQDEAVQSDLSSAPSSGPITVVKATDQIVNNSDVLQDDSDLKFNVGANEIWTARLVLSYESATLTPTIKISFNGPASPVSVLFNSYAGYNGDNMRAGRQSYGTSYGAEIGSDFSGSLKASNSLLYTDLVLVNGANAGVVTFQWAQWTATAEDTKIRAGSSLLAFKA